MKVKQSFQWHRTCSCIPGPIEIPAGVSVHLSRNGFFYVDTSYFLDKGMIIEAHDATYYGCRVDPTNVTY
jgi:hypothetical protein